MSARSYAAKPIDADTSSDELPEGWATAKLEDCSRLITKGSTPTSYGFKYRSSGINFVRVENLDHGQIDRTTLSVFIDKKADETLKRSRLQAGDLLFSIAGTIGRTAFVKPDDLPANTNQALAIIRGTDQVFRPQYLLFALSSSVAQHQAGRGARGGGMNNISLADVGSLELPIAPDAEQTRIISKIEELQKHVNAAREHLAKVVKILKAFRQSVLTAACSGRLTEDWREKTSDSVAPAESEEGDLPPPWSRPLLRTLLESSFYGPRFPAEAYCSAGVPTIRTSDMAFDGSIVLQDAPRIELSAQELAKFALHDGDLLVTRTGATIGKCAVYDCSLGPAIPSAYLIRFRFRRELVNPRFLLMFFMSPAGQSLLVGGTTAVAQPNVNAKTISEFSAPLPPLLEQHEIVRRADILLKLADKIKTRVEAATKRADKLTQSILARAFRGELVPTEAELARRERREYEPASALPDRIKAERARSIASNNGARRRNVKRTRK